MKCEMERERERDCNSQTRGHRDRPLWLAPSDLSWFWLMGSPCVSCRRWLEHTSQHTTINKMQEYYF